MYIVWNIVFYFVCMYVSIGDEKEGWLGISKKFKVWINWRIWGKLEGEGKGKFKGRGYENLYVKLIF